MSLRKFLYLLEDLFVPWGFYALVGVVVLGLLRMWWGTGEEYDKPLPGDD